MPSSLVSRIRMAVLSEEEVLAKAQSRKDQNEKSLSCLLLASLRLCENSLSLALLLQLLPPQHVVVVLREAVRLVADVHHEPEGG